jgi:outer membrane lipoprotein carrier protein
MAAMRSRRGLAFACTAAALLAGAGARADGEEPKDCAREIAARVQARYDGVQDLEARFTQKSRSVAFGGASPAQEMEASGVALFAKPGRMRWTYEKPEPSLVVSDGKTLWIYDPTRREVQEFDVGQGFLSGTAVQFLLGEGRIAEAFEVRAERCAGETVRLFLKPREETTYESLELVVVPATGDVRGTAVVDLFGNRTDVAFESLVSNRHPDPARFRFQAEPGVRVLRANEPAGGRVSE